MGFHAANNRSLFDGQTGSRVMGKGTQSCNQRLLPTALASLKARTNTGGDWRVTGSHAWLKRIFVSVRRCKETGEHSVVPSPVASRVGNAQADAQRVAAVA